MKAANARGTIGPNLDSTFRAAREQGLGDSTFVDVVAGQIRDPGQYPTEGDQESKLQANMPPNLVEGDDLADVAAFVGKYAGSDLAPPGGGASAAGGGGGGTDGKSIFAANCASCHTLAAAGSSGTIGPNLDDLKPSLGRAKQQVIHGGGAMPAFKGQLSDKQIDAVAKFVSENAGK
jgi:mono/diheme cytochrome c family protein